MTVNPRQFGFGITGFPDGNPHLNAETQREAGLVKKEHFYPPHPEFEDQTENPLVQHGSPRWSDDWEPGTVEEAEAEGFARNRLKLSPSSWEAQRSDEGRLFSVQGMEARPQDQTPDQWLRRPDVMFHTGISGPYQRDETRQIHFGTAAAGHKVSGPTGLFKDERKSVDTIARRIPDLDDYANAIDVGDQDWDPSISAQYQNVSEDAESVSVVTHGNKTKSWVDDQLPAGRFSDYASQLQDVARSRGSVDDVGHPDTSFHFRKHETTRAEHRRRTGGQEMPDPGMIHHQRLNPGTYDGAKEGWNDVWNRTLSHRQHT